MARGESATEMVGCRGGTISMYVIGDVAYGATTSTDCVDMCSLEFVLTSVVFLHYLIDLILPIHRLLPPTTHLHPYIPRTKRRVREKF
jgi:hypothetical protein